MTAEVTASSSGGGGGSPPSSPPPPGITTVCVAEGTVTLGGPSGASISVHGRRVARAAALVLVVVAVVAPSAGAEQASDPAVAQAGWLDLGDQFSCAVLPNGSVRCWGEGASGELGYGNTNDVGATDTPAQAGPVNLGAGQTATAIAAGAYHACALLATQQVKCWGYGDNGRLGYGSDDSVLDPSTVGPVDLGGPARAITAGEAHTCAILVSGTVECWGYGGDQYANGAGGLGYGTIDNVADGGSGPATPAAAGAVNLGSGRTAVAITAGETHTCAILDDGSVRCWGNNAYGQLGYGNTNDVGTTPTTTPNTAGPVDLGQKAIAISAGGNHTCALLADQSVDCWGSGDFGELGYGNTANVGDILSDTPNPLVPIDLGGQKATAVSSGDDDTCVILVGGSVKCWGWGQLGRLGYPTLDSLGNQPNIGDGWSDLSVAAAGTVDLGAGRTAVAISAGGDHTCALLDNDSVRCWGGNSYGQLGYCNTATVGETNTPGSVGPVNLQPGDGGQTCPDSGAGASVSSATTGTQPAPGPGPAAAAAAAAATRAQAQRSKALRRCLSRANRLGRGKRLGRRGSRRLAALRPEAQAACLRRYGRSPGPITGLLAGAVSRSEIELLFFAPGTDGLNPPPTQGYMVKMSRRPISTWRGFQRAPALCGGDCVFSISSVGDIVRLTVTDLRPDTRYYFALAARDNVSLRCGPRSPTVTAETGDVNPPLEPGMEMEGPGVQPPALRIRRAPPCQRAGVDPRTSVSPS